MKQTHRADQAYNVVVIGAGSAGLVTAGGTAGLGGRVALIERHKMGGDCLNTGCVPSKALISSARLIQQIRHAEEWGLDAQEPSFQFERVFERMRARRAKIAPHDSVERFESLGVDVYQGEARFVSPHEVEVGGTRLRAAHFVIATGSRSSLPQIEGLAEIPHFTNENIFDELHQRPERLAVIGGGPIGCELGQVMARLGVQVTLIHHGDEILSKEDADVGAFIRKQLETEGVTVMLGAKTQCARSLNGHLRLEFAESAPLDVDAILVSAGRVPNIENLDLAAAGVRHNKRGVEVNERLQSSQPHIYAAGDVAGGLQFTHTADVMARTVIRNILMPIQMLRAKVDLSVVPWATYTDPEVGRVGLSEKAAQEADIEYDLIRVPMGEVDRAVCESEEAGFVKVLTRKGGDEILGVTLVGAHAGDLLHEFVLAMRHGIGLGKIASTIHAYPTFAELARKAGDQYNKTRLTPFAKKLFSALYRFSLRGVHARAGTEKTSS